MNIHTDFLEALRNYIITVSSEEGSRTDEDFVDRRIELALEEFSISSRLEMMVETAVESYLDNHLDDACEQAIADRQYIIKDVVDETLQNAHINITSEAEIEIN